LKSIIKKNKRLIYSNIINYF